MFYSYVTRMLVVCTRILLVCTRMLLDRKLAGACTDAFAICRDVELVLFDTVVSSRFLDIFYFAALRRELSRNRMAMQVGYEVM